MNANNKTPNEPPDFEVLPPERKKDANVLKSVLVVFIGVLATLYLVNPTAGLLEFLPDNLPIVGNLDEVGATAILISCFAYFGIDIKPFQSFFQKNNKPK